MGASGPVTVLGQYRLTALLGEGGMARVYRAMAAEGGGREVAVKVLDQTVALPETARQRFVREIFTLATLSHPNIVPVIDYGETQGLLYYVMPLLRSGTLEAKLAGGARLPVPELGRLCEDLLEALRYLHSRGFLHRDIKPGNIMFGDSGSAILMDFGLVKSEKGSSLTRTGRVIGTPRYIPPEVLKDGDVDETSDLYQVGVVAYQAATGVLPYGDEAMLGILVDEEQGAGPESPSKLNGLIAEPLAAFLLNAVEWRRARRYPDANTALEDLGRAMACSPVGRRKAAGPVSRAVRTLKAGALAGRYELLQTGRAAPGVDYIEGQDNAGEAVYLRPLPPLAGTEAETLKVMAPHAGVQHGVLANIRDLVLQGSQPFLVYDRAPGFSFLEPPAGLGTGSRAQSIRRLLSLLSGLEALHARGLVHGEVSLQNVTTGPADEVRLLGMGVYPIRQAGLLERPPGDSTARINSWMAPEQHDGQPASAAADVYAAGRLLSLLVHGRLLPATAGASSEGDDSLGRVLARATAKAAADRYPTAREFALELGRLVEGQRPSRSDRRSARPIRLEGPVASTSSWPRSRIAVTAGAVLAVAALYFLTR